MPNFVSMSKSTSIFMPMKLMQWNERKAQKRHEESG